MDPRLRAGLGAESLVAMQQKAVSGRAVAFDVLCRMIEQPQFAAHILDQVLNETRPADVDRRQATELTYGIVRREATLDAILSSFVRRGRGSVEPELWVLLRLGAYQLVFLDGVPPHAAVNETVALAKAGGKSRWVGFANGILRAISRSLPGEDVIAPAPNAVPTRNGQYRCFDRELFPDPENQPTEYFAAAFGFNSWISDRWQVRFGFAELLRIGFWFNMPAPLYLRVNTLRTSRDALLERLHEAQVLATAGELSESIKLEGPVRITELPGFTEGLFTVQDESAMAVARLLNPAPGTRVWDMCAAPGGKTGHLAEIMQGEGEVLATDIDADRLKRVVQARERLGLNNITTSLIAPDGTDYPAGPFDAILLDAPCSNTGVLGKRAEARYRVTEDHLKELRTLQIQLLNAGLERLGPGGRFVYSTCSMEPEENYGVIAAVLATHKDVQLLEDHEQIPGSPADGGYQALLGRQ